MPGIEDARMNGIKHKLESDAQAEVEGTFLMFADSVHIRIILRGDGTFYFPEHNWPIQQSDSGPLNPHH